MPILNEDGIQRFEKKWGPKSPKEWKEIVYILCLMNDLILEFYKSEDRPKFQAFIYS
jgi:hypothetical protein